jgi:hypothetical protein
VRATGACGIVTDAGGKGAAIPGDGDGMGCRGPDKIWPGRGVGTGRAGMGPVRKGGCTGAAPPADSGGLKGAGLLRSGSSTEGVVTGASCAGVVADASNSLIGVLAACVVCSGVDTAGGSCGGGCGCRVRSSCLTTSSALTSSSADSGSATATEVSASRRIAAPAPPCTLWRIISATGSSIELEWVFFSATPSSGNMSMMACEGTSSCLASSLIRILLINNGNTGSRCA